MKHIICYSNGTQSASVAIAVVEKHGKENCILLNHGINTKREPESVTQFGLDVANALEMKITYANIDKIKNLEDIPDQFEVCEKAGSFVNPKNRQILCTNRLKTAPFMKWLEDEGYNNSNCIIYYGFDVNEPHREERRHKIMCSLGFETLYPLRQMNVPNDLYKKFGIETPEHYEVFNHGNCWGCLKAGKQHWYCVYCLKYEVFARAKQSESTIGYSIIKSGFMKDFEPLFEKMKAAGIEPTEKIKSQTFWAIVRRTLKDIN